MQINDIRNAIRNFFNPAEASRQLHIDLVSHKDRIKELKAEYDTIEKWKYEYASTLGLLTDAIQTLVWKKDIEHRYLLANPFHCRKFFGFEGSQECLDYIVGKTDAFMVKRLFRDHGIQNTFGEICMMSDHHAMECAEVTHYLEAGVVDGDEVLLYAVKIPRFKGGVFMGTVGIAWDMTSQAGLLMTQLQRWIYDGKVSKLYHKKDVFCYAIKPSFKKCMIFQHICLSPERGKDCNNNCELCENEGAE
jgi:hypothetical protein